MIMQKYNKNFQLKKQQGAAALLMSLILLALITIITLYTAKNIVMEKKIGGNDFRSKLAFEDAETGLHDTLNFFKIKYVGDLADFDNTDFSLIDVDNYTVTLTDNANPNVTQSVTYAGGAAYDIANFNLIDKDNVYIVGLKNSNSSSSLSITDDSAGVAGEEVEGLGPFDIVSVGSSEDNTASRTISILTNNVDPLPNVPGNPLTSKSAVIINGSATVYNPEGHSTIWSGESVDLGSNNSTATYVANPSDVAYPACMDSSVTCSGTQSSNRTSIGLDVIEHDSSLGNLSEDEMFINVFGIPPDVYRDSTADMVIDAANIADAFNATGKIIWVDGHTTINGETIGCSVDIVGINADSDNLPSKTCTDTPIVPSILIINGDLTTIGSPVFYGLVYVMGNLQGGGNPTVEGAIVLGGDNNSAPSGSVDIWYNSDLLEALRNLGSYSAASGTWSDWN